MNELHKKWASQEVLRPNSHRLNAFAQNLWDLELKSKLYYMDISFQDSQARKILWERARSNVCMFLYEFLQRLRDIFEDLEGYGMKSLFLALLFCSFFLPLRTPTTLLLLCFGIPFIVDMVLFLHTRMSLVCWVNHVP